MNSLSVSPAANLRGETSSYVSGSLIHLRKGLLGADQWKGPLNQVTRVWLKHLGQSTTRNGCRFSVVARIKKGQRHEYPWPDNIDPNLESGHLSYLSHFKPLTEKPKPVTLDFEKPLLELEKKIIDVRKMADETGLDFTDQINLLERKYQQVRKDLYTHLTPIQRVNIARHPNRPTFLDHVLNITDKWVELHGDRAGYNDPAIVTGLGSIEGKTYMLIGHQKGRNTKENIKRNFGMPTPHGYRKALRMMRYADHHGFPIITFVDTPGAFADLKSEELGQGESIAFNLRTMFGLKVPIVTVVIGEGGSGGALAIACANKMYMLENSVFYVASPEACAAILWKTAKAAPKAAERLKITATELCKLKIADGIIPEPLGGAHTDQSWTSQQIKIKVLEGMEELSAMDEESLLQHRYMKYRRIGRTRVGKPVEPEKMANMKKKEVGLNKATARSLQKKNKTTAGSPEKMANMQKKEADLNKTTADIEMEIENLKKAALEAKSKSPVLTISEEAIEKLKEEVDKEMANAFASMGLQEKLDDLEKELSKYSSSPDQTLSPALKERADRLVQEFKFNLSRPGAYTELNQKLALLSDVSKLQDQNERAEKLKEEINQKLNEKVKSNMEVLSKARDKVAQGEQLNDTEIEEVENAKEDLREMLKSMNLEVVGTVKKRVPTAPPGLEEKFTKADDVIQDEIEKTIDKAGLRGKIEELKAEIASGSDIEKVDKLEKEIREEIASYMDFAELKKKVESTVDGESSHAELPVEEILGAGNHLE